MRESLQKLLESTLIKKYSLPNEEVNIEAVELSTECDEAFFCNSNSNLVEIIYNSIVDYSFNEFDITDDDYFNLLNRALLTNIRYEEGDKEDTKIKYGFYGEVLGSVDISF